MTVANVQTAISYQVNLNSYRAITFTCRQKNLRERYELTYAAAIA